MLYKENFPENSKIKVEETGEGSGYVEGYASVFNNVDLGGDVVKPGAFRKTIKERLKKGMIKLYDSHQLFEGTGAVIGLVKDAKEDDYGLWFHADFSSVSRAQEVRTKIREGILNATSFGYDIIKSNPRGENEEGYDLTELRLWEVSIVPWGMNPKAEPRTVKSLIKISDFELASKDHDWNPMEARKRIAEWADGDWKSFRKCFLWVDASKAEETGGYFFPVCDVIDGSPKYVLSAATAALKRARGEDESVWKDDATKIEEQIEEIYKKFDVELPEKGMILDPDFAGSVGALAKEASDYALAVKLRSMREELER